MDPARPVVVFCGHQPGREEDVSGEMYTGPSGKLFRHVYLDSLGLSLSVNIVLTNLVRCWPQADKPRPLHIRACSTHLFSDLRALSSLPGPHYLVLLGGEAVKALLGCTLSEALRNNCSPWTPPDLPVPWTVISTFHPAFLLSKRNPNAIHAVADHLQLLLDRLSSTPVLRSSPRLLPPSPPPLHVDRRPSEKP